MIIGFELRPRNESFRLLVMLLLWRPALWQDIEGPCQTFLFVTLAARPNNSSQPSYRESERFGISLIGELPLSFDAIKQAVSGREWSHIDGRLAYFFATK
jgi:hypothetical protein